MSSIDDMMCLLQETRDTVIAMKTTLDAAVRPMLASHEKDIQGLKEDVNKVKGGLTASQAILVVGLSVISVALTAIGVLAL